MTLIYRAPADAPRLADLFPPIVPPRGKPGPCIADALRSAGQIRRPAQSVAGQA